MGRLFPFATLAAALGAVALAVQLTLRPEASGPALVMTKVGPVWIVWVVIAPMAAIIALELIAGRTGRGLLRTVHRREDPGYYWWTVGTHVVFMVIILIACSVYFGGRN